MISNIDISICIPTFNRAHTLRSLLSSIESEINSLQYYQIEIVISDNASTDDTARLVEHFSKRLDIVNYVKLPENRGLGYNINNAINTAKGRFCWLMGSDEKLYPGSLAKIISELESDSDILIGNPITNNSERIFFREKKYNYSVDSPQEIARFIDNCTELSSFFAFISTIVVKKSFWNKCEFPLEWINHTYTHLLRLVSIIKAGETKIKTLGYPIVITGNEMNEWNKRIFNHFSLDNETLFLISHSIFEDNSEIKSAISGLISRQYNSFNILLSRSAASKEEWNTLIPILKYLEIGSGMYKKEIYDPILYIMYRTAKKFKVIVKKLKAI
ncbi:hypothetical protein CE143_24710 [Photorhabdus luminescens]|uniref:Glycosyltransferase 2-like domain-containing protein n=1 Tax=Photorhabdus akhurstii TaxID=171438 RepID=A0ABX8M4Z9_9GAMM|nr:glycosyltransferase family 2 protein [Photorhabdus akhurstii]QXF36024.1 hypothetical protein B0X70_24670 [Photorhabdus akhurstii]UJD77864.1 hypothetical protein CE143_24710 [Photorhabdus luminescens]